jgi:adenylate cyclase class 2
MVVDSDKNLEIEVKFRVEDPEKIVEKLHGLGAKKVDSGFESNIVFDKDGELPDSKLLDSRKLLRIRSYDGNADITFKKEVSREKFNVREENIVIIDSFDKGKKLLEALGFKPWWRYEKKRQTWEYDGTGILVDEVPIGNFVEIEGPEDKIEEIAKKLGLDMKDSIKKSYLEVFSDYCKEQGIPFSDMVFKEEK